MDNGQRIPTVGTSVFARDLSRSVALAVNRLGYESEPVRQLQESPEFCRELVAEIWSRIDWSEVRRRLEELARA